MDIPNLIVEVTRRCNMSCSHCLRGEDEDIDINLRYISTLLKQTKSISNVTFSGGEPSMNTKAIEYFLNKCKEYKIELGSFYIATNAKEIDIEFVILCLKLYAYCWDKEMCSVVVSNDVYHSYEGNYNTEMLDGLGFFSRKHSEEKDNMGVGLILEGRAALNYGTGRPNLQVNEITDVEGFNDSYIYINVNGDIINGCDWSYESQEEYIICKVSKLTNFYNKLKL